MKTMIRLAAMAMLMICVDASPSSAKEMPNPVFFARPKGDQGPAIAYDLATGRERFNLPSGILAADGSAFAAADGTHVSGTTFTLFDAHTGDKTLTMPLAGKWWPNAVSPDARFVALARMPNEKETQAWAKSGQWQTEFQIIDTQSRRTKHMLKLDGRFEAEALSKDGTSLFLVEHLPSAKPDHYAIRWYDLSAQHLMADPLRSKTADEIMSGYAWGGAATADGEWLFTLYISTNRKVAFVHMLNTQSAFTVCVDLPSNAANFDDLRAYTLAYSAKKQTLYAANARLGAVAEINLGNYAFNGTGNKFVPNKVVNFKPVTNGIFSSANLPIPNAVLARNEARLFFANGGVTYAYDTARGTVDRTFRADSAITGLGLREDGKLVVAQWNLNTVKTFDVLSETACPVTQPRRVETVRDGVRFDPSFVIGDSKFWTEVTPDNVARVLPEQIEPNGSTSLKWPWIFDDRVEGDFAVEAQRLDGLSPAPVLKDVAKNPSRAYSPDFEAGTGVIITSMAFPSEGCWQVTATKGRETLRFVTKVIKVARG